MTTYLWLAVAALLLATVLTALAAGFSNGGYTRREWAASITSIGLVLWLGMAGVTLTWRWVQGL